jgi:hypothetical protein
MKNRLWIAALVVVVACNKKDKVDQPPATGSASTSTAGATSTTARFDQALAELAALKDRVCACKDSACVDQTMNEGTKAKVDLPRERTDDQASQLAAVNKQLADCMAARMK